VPLGQIHEAIIDQRGRLYAAHAKSSRLELSQRHRKGKLQIADIRGGDLIQRRVAIGIMGPVDHQPVASFLCGTGIEQSLRCDRVGQDKTGCQCHECGACPGRISS